MPWHARAPVSRRRLPPAGFIVPCQPTLVAAPPKGPLWLHEIKYDGFRMLARVGECRVRIWSRNALDWTNRLPRIAAALAGLPVSSVVLDGEVVAFDEQGRPTFNGLRSTVGQESAVYVVWDVLEMDGEDLRDLPLRERRKRLDKLLPEPVDNIIATEIFDSGPALFRTVCAMGLEGIVSKRLDAPYRSGRALTWLKVKCSDYVRHGGAG